MMRKEKIILFKKCLRKWRLNAQIDMCIEEMAELTQALCKAKRHEKPKNWLENVYEELADVSIMIEQMIIFFDGDVSVKNQINLKLQRLKETAENEITPRLR